MTDEAQNDAQLRADAAIHGFIVTDANGRRIDPTTISTPEPTPYPGAGGLTLEN